MNQEHGQTGYQWLLTLIVLSAFALRFYVLNDVAFHIDEATVVSRYMDRPILDSLTKFFIGSHIFTTFLSRLSIVILGPSLFALRWSAAAMATLSVPLTYRLASSMFDRRVGIVSAFLLSVSPFHIAYAYHMRGYSGTLFFPLLSLCCLYLALLPRLRSGQVAQKRRYWLGFILASTLSVYTHLFALLTLAVSGVIIIFWIRTRSLVTSQGFWQQARTPLVSLGAVCLVLLLLYLPGMIQAWGGSGLTEEVRISTSTPTSGPKVEGTPLNTYVEFSGAALTNKVHSQPLGDRPWELFVYADLALLGMLYGFIRGERRPILVLLAWNALPFAFLALGQLLIGWIWTRPQYLGFILPAYLILTGRGIVGLGELLRGWMRTGWAGWQKVSVVATSALLGLLLAALSLPNVALAVGYLSAETRGNWSQVAGYLAGVVKPQDLILCQVYSHSWKPSTPSDNCTRDLSYRLKQQVSLLYPVQTTAAIGYQAVADNASVIAQPGKVWLVVWDAPDRLSLEDGSGALRASFDRYGVTGVFYSGDGRTLLDNAIGALQLLSRLGPTPDERFDYYWRLAQLEAARGHQGEAAVALSSAEAIQPDHPLARSIIEETRALLRRPPLLPDIGHVVGAVLGDQVELVGYSVDRTDVAPGQAVQLALFWKALRPISEDYTIFVHLRDATNTTVAQQDFQPFDGAYPTRRWQVGEIVAETRQFRLPAGLVPGVYEMRIGMYRPDTLERLPVASDGSGENAIILLTLHVTNEASPQTD
jgi:mannosyltransferase